MTENEAIKILKKTTEHTKVYEDDVVFTSDFVKAYEMAIQALEEIQQYRAIGTVKEIKIREAQFARLSEGYLNDLTLLREYQAIGTIEEFKALKEKNEPKKPIERKRFNHTVFGCPTCNAELYTYQRFCDECGQSILNDYD